MFLLFPLGCFRSSSDCKEYLYAKILSLEGLTSGLTINLKPNTSMKSVPIPELALLACLAPKPNTCLVLNLSVFLFISFKKRFTFSMTSSGGL